MNKFSSGDALEVLEVDFGVEVQARLDLGHHVRGTGNVIVHVMAGLEVAGVVSELAAAHLDNLVDLASFGFDFLRNGADEFIDGAV